MMEVDDGLREKKKDVIVAEESGLEDIGCSRETFEETFSRMAHNIDERMCQQINDKAAAAAAATTAIAAPKSTSGLIIKTCFSINFVKN
jgi:hypothetical protein